jgi:GNAT superfamily N-acetyltransferase
MKIIRANKEHLDLIVPLFDSYRVFYEQVSDEKGAKFFLEKRLDRDESIIFLALIDNKPVGFVQLFTSFSSVSLESIYILNDLYVDSSFRNKGIGKALLNKAKEQCASMKFKGLALETAKTNPAQHLYESLGWKKDVDCFHYFWTPHKNE